MNKFFKPNRPSSDRRFFIVLLDTTAPRNQLGAFLGAKK
ncbi:hypothetical protein AO367_1921 [Moraxella catarrhalis]|nr:hypothetical protein AO367_1921 [Moraxella catarrhalis]